MKTALKLLLLLGIMVYLFFAFTRFARQGDNTLCEGVDIAVADSAHAGFITPEEADHILQKSGYYPTGKPMKEISSIDIEKALLKNPFIKEVVCYKTPASRISVLISQRLPLLRIMADNGDDYYIDDRGYAMAPLGYVANLAIATGNIDRRFAKEKLVPLGLFLRQNDFWDDQVEQICVDKEKEIDLVPRVGDHIIHVGRPDSISKKFRNLRTFYEKVLPEVGWNKYAEIDIQHTNQIVGVKREKKRS